MPRIVDRLPLLLCLALPGLAAGQGRPAFALSGSRIWIEGKSNIRDWTCEAKQVDVSIVVDSAGLATSAQRLVREAMTRVPVAEIRCGNGTMDDHLRKALKADQNPGIAFRLVRAEGRDSGNDSTFALTLLGRLTIAGVENPVTIEAVGTRLADGTLKAAASVPLRMTAFGVKPPTALLGTLKTADAVTVRFELLVGLLPSDGR